MTNSELFEIREQDTRLAIAMGWRKVQMHNKEQYAVVPPDWKDTSENRLRFLGRPLFELVPRFHEDHGARFMLLEWIGKDPDLWRSFTCRLTDVVYPQVGDVVRGVRISELLHATMLADPAVVATAADRALRETGYYVEMEK